MKSDSRALRYLSYLYILFFALDDNPYGLYMALPWILYLAITIYRTGWAKGKNRLAAGLIFFFVLMQFYDKSQSTIYHPILRQKIVLQKPLYLSEGFHGGCFNASDSNFTIDNHPVVAVPKGKRLEIVSVRRRDFLPDIASYYLTIKTDKEVLKTLHRDSTLCFWNNNFFDFLGTLVTMPKSDVSLTVNPLFKLLLFFYPFALVYLLMENFHGVLKKIKNRLGFHPLDLVLYSVAYYYVLMAAVNDGFSGFWLGIPYAVYLFFDLVFNKSAIKYLHIPVLALTVFLNVTDRSHSSFFYPLVGKSYVVNHDVNYSYGDFYINDIEIYESPYLLPYDEKKRLRKPIFTLRRGDIFTLEAQYVTGHPEFGIDYTFEIDSQKFERLKAYIASHEKEIKAKLDQDYASHFHRPKSVYYFKDKNRFYIGRYELHDLLKSQNYPYRPLARFDTGFVYMTFHLLSYPVIFALFIIVLGYRIRTD